MAVNTLTLYLPGSSVGIQVYEGSQLHLILVSQGANSIPSAPGETVRQDPYPQYVDGDELAEALAGLGGVGGGAVSSVNGKTGAVVLDADNIADSTTRKLMTSDERDKLANIPDNGAAPTLANIPAGSVLYVNQNGDGTWPNRPTSRTDVKAIWTKTVAGSADPASVTSPTVTGAYANDLVVGV